VVETQAFENTLLIEPPPAPPGAPVAHGPARVFQLDQKTLLVGGGALAVLIVILFGIAMVLRRFRKSRAEVTAPIQLPGGADPAAELEAQKQLAEADAVNREAEAKAMNSLKLVTPVITKTAEIMAKHLREKITQEPEVSAQVLRTWIREEEFER